MLHEVEGVNTPLIRRLARFSVVITQFIIVCCAIVFLAGVLVGRDIPEMLMAVVALAVSAIPEGLPAIMTIALAIGVSGWLPATQSFVNSLLWKHWAAPRSSAPTRLEP